SLLVEPLKETLSKVDLRIESLEKFGANSQGMLDQQIKQLYDSHRSLSSETANLVQALRTPNVRGRWGEFQLKRVVEMAGMVEYCDFEEQVSVTTEDTRLRPDMLIRLPNQRTIVVDSKVPFSAYQESIQAQTEEIRAEKLVDHARLVRNHVTQLGSKEYWKQFPSSPDFVILFLSAEPFYFAAVEKDPTLMEYAAERKVLIAAPMSLVAMLKVIAYGWRQESLEENAREISKLGKILYERLATVSNHINGIKKGLESAVTNYNRAVSSLETRVFPAARRFKDLSVESVEEIPFIEAIESLPKEINIEVSKIEEEKLAITKVEDEKEELIIS
ncbi:MAG: DNA recombination protein RmuC, partial [Proteobacteria bacterium]|nr:DNA recombination protein RmuC [Pseudomonadota bacterium]